MSTFTEDFLGAKNCANLLTAISSFILKTVLWDRHYYCPYLKIKRQKYRKHQAVSQWQNQNSYPSHLIQECHQVTVPALISCPHINVIVGKMWNKFYQKLPNGRFQLCWHSNTPNELRCIYFNKSPASMNELRKWSAMTWMSLYIPVHPYCIQQ